MQRNTGWGRYPSKKKVAAVTTDRFVAVLLETEAIRLYEKDLELAEAVERIARRLYVGEVAYT